MKLQKYGGDRIMLLQFRFKNYMSFKDEAVLDMTATSIKEHQDTLIEVNGSKILPVAAVYGANASGKSNLFRAFNVMTEVVLGKVTKKSSIIPYVFNSKTWEEPSEFEVSILIGLKEYRFGFLKNRKKVFEEWLYEKKFSKNTVKEKCIYHRINDTEDKIVLSETNEKERREIFFVASMNSDSELIMTGIGKRKKSKFHNIYNWFDITNYNMNFSDDSDELSSIDSIAEVLYPLQKENNQVFNDIVNLLIEFDEAIVGMKIDKDQNGDVEQEYKVYIIHRNEDNKKEGNAVSINVESSGTKKLLSIAFWLIFAIQVGGVLFVDELDAKLHPLVLRYIVRLFTDKEKNIGKGQIIFSAHNLVCLDSTDLRRDEIWFVEKNNQQSSLYSLYDFKEDESAIRSDLNFGKNYLSGRFGAIPYQD